MGDSQQKTVKLQDLSLIAINGTSAKRVAEIEQKQRQAEQEFVKVNKDVAAFFAKLVPNVINVICTLNKSIRLHNHELLFNGYQVSVEELTSYNCIQVCRRAMADFSESLTKMVNALKTSATADYMEDISQKLCSSYNTVVAFSVEKERLQSERLKNIQLDISSKDNIDDTDNFSEVIALPIGKEENKEVCIRFDIGGPDAHAVISGKTGTGKSSFLQSIILGGAYKYSPEQLQFWILDFKDGNGLIQFKDLKHVKMMSVKNRATDANEIAELIKQERDRRFTTIREIGGGSIIRYNRIAKERGMSLLPRLFIIIDEFTVMNRECFNVLNDVAKRGRSIGMSFILSSQIVEKNSAQYGDAVNQANHFFEYQNEGSLFGRLITDVSADERQYVESGEKGRCVYRHNSERYKIAVAYAGEVEEQVDFIEKINEKWDEFPFEKPIITGDPQRVEKTYKAIEVNSLESKTTFEKYKKIYVPIGESRSGKKYLYNIDRENQILLAFGDESRVASVEYSVMENFKCLSDIEKAVYYIDLNCNPDRTTTSVIAAYGDGGDSKVCYVATDSGAKSAIKKVYSVMQNRQQLVRIDRSKDIGNPIELIIHNAERILELKDDKRSSQTVSIKRNGSVQASSSVLSNDLSLLFADSPEVNGINALDAENDIDILTMLKEIVSTGKNSRIYVMMYFEERNQFSAVADKIFGYNYDYKDVLIVPKIPNEREGLSYSEISGVLTACRLREQAAGFITDKLEQSDFIYAVIIDDKVMHKIIPYEWSAEE